MKNPEEQFIKEIASIHKPEAQAKGDHSPSLRFRLVYVDIECIDFLPVAPSRYRRPAGSRIAKSSRDFPADEPDTAAHADHNRYGPCWAAIVALGR